MENQLIQIYLFVCQIYDTCSETCFQRASNKEPLFTDQELITMRVLCPFKQLVAEKTNAQFY